VPKGVSFLARLSTLALSLWAPRKWVALSEALKQIGSSEALLVALRAGRIAARYESIHTAIRDGDRYGVGAPLPASIAQPPGRAIPSNWWKYTLPPFELEHDRAVFQLDWLKTLAIGVEVERATLKASLPAQRNRGGRPVEHDWTGAQQYAEKDFADHGPFPTKARLADSLEKYFRSVRHEDTPTRENIERWLRNEARRTWADKLVLPG
jgi:hypothetical protein